MKFSHPGEDIHRSREAAVPSEGLEADIHSIERLEQLVGIGPSAVKRGGWLSPNVSREVIMIVIKVEVFKVRRAFDQCSKLDVVFADEKILHLNVKLLNFGLIVAHQVGLITPKEPEQIFTTPRGIERWRIE